MKIPTQTLKPTKFEVWVGYTCPDCGVVNYLTEAKVKVKGQIIECCDKVWTVEDVTKVEVVLNNYPYSSMVPLEPKTEPKIRASLTEAQYKAKK